VELVRQCFVGHGVDELLSGTPAAQLLGRNRCVPDVEKVVDLGLGG
jgi:hypothetical protein